MLTNYEIKQILRIYNGSREIEIIKNMYLWRIKHKWLEKNNKMVNTSKIKSKPPHGYRIIKGSAFVVVDRQFLEYITSDQKPIELLEWAKDTFSPDEW